MSNLPKELIASFSNMSNLILRENDLEVWKAEYLENAELLKSLYITENPIGFFPDKSFAHCSDLSSLAISFTKVEYFQPEVFEGLPTLEILELNNNPIGDTLEAETFSLVKHHLKRLKISDIGLKTFPGGFFDGFGELTSLIIKDNLIVEIDARIFPQNLKTVEISKNHISYQKD